MYFWPLAFGIFKKQISLNKYALSPKSHIFNDGGKYVHLTGREESFLIISRMLISSGHAVRFLRKDDMRFDCEQKPIEIEGNCQWNSLKWPSAGECAWRGLQLSYCHASTKIRGSYPARTMTSDSAIFPYSKLVMVEWNKSKYFLWPTNNWSCIKFILIQLR